MDPAALREQFPVFERIAYLNAGTCGPLPGAALRSAADVALRAAEDGRATPYFGGMTAAAAALRAAYAQLLGAVPEDVALTTGTSSGLTTMLGALGLQPGDEVLTATHEHPGLLGPLGAMRRHRGIIVREVPLRQIAEAVDERRTKLVACSHVGWTTGEVAPEALAHVGRVVPVLLDGAQGAGAVPVDVRALGCFAYAAAGQKWACGPVGTGMLWVDPAWHERLADERPTYGNLADPAAGLDARPWEDARAFDADALSPEVMAAASASAAVLAEFGWEAVHSRAQALCAELVQRLHDAGREVAPRGASTLVSWTDPDPAAFVERAAAAEVIVRALPGTHFVRAAVGAWNATEDLDRLIALL